MSNFVFALAKAAPFSDRAGVAGIVTLQGMLTIFGVLAILWAAVEIMHFALHIGDKKKKHAPEGVPAPQPMAEAVPEAPAEEEEDNGAIVAAIIAAISAMRAEEGNTTGFRVVSFKRNGHKK